MYDMCHNVVRIHLQLEKFMNWPREPNKPALRRLSRLLKVAAKTGLYLDLTGLGIYHLQDTPDWYASLEEQDRWNVQSEFWTPVAGVGSGCLRSETRRVRNEFVRNCRTRRPPIPIKKTKTAR